MLQFPSISQNNSGLGMILGFQGSEDGLCVEYSLLPQVNFQLANILRSAFNWKEI